MSTIDITGRFSPGHETKDHPQDFPGWHFTSDDWRTAMRISSLLGGEPQKMPDSDKELWTVYTKRSRFNVIIHASGDPFISFRLALDRDLGMFRLSSKSQMLMETLVRELSTTPHNGHYELSIKPIEVTTRNGLIVTYLRPFFLSPN